MPVADRIDENAVLTLGGPLIARLLAEQAARDPALRDQLQAAITALSLPAEPGADTPLIGSSPAMQAVDRALTKMAAAEVPVLVTGESGTGKELAAAELHRRSRRSGGPFVPVNCAALPASLINSELFGHEKGAFTGAEQRRTGKIQAAEGGTLFLDEIGDLPLDLQAHLLRFLQEGTIERVGHPHPIKVDVRVVAATNVPLLKAVEDGKFRGDLYYRLNVLTLDLPPLRAREGDIDRLSLHFLRLISQDMGRRAPALSARAREALHRYSWPGNVRELMATMRRAAIMAEGNTIEVRDLGLPADSPAATAEEGRRALASARRGVEVRTIQEALAANGYNIKSTAAALGISRVTLYRLMEKHGIET